MVVRIECPPRCEQILLRIIVFWILFIPLYLAYSWKHTHKTTSHGLILIFCQWFSVKIWQWNETVTFVRQCNSHLSLNFLLFYNRKQLAHQIQITQFLSFQIHLQSLCVSMSQANVLFSRLKVLFKKESDQVLARWEAGRN